MELSKFLQEANKKWGETVQKAASGAFTNPPDGTYIMQLTSAEVANSKSSEKLMVKWGHTILEGDLAGTLKYDYSMLETERGLEFLAWRLQALGVSLEDVDLTKLEEILESLVDRNIVMKVSLKTPPNSDFQNVRIIKVLPSYGGEESSPAAMATEPLPAPSANGSAPASDDEEVDLKPGDRIAFMKDGERKEAPIVSTDEASGSVVVKLGLKKVTVKADDIVEILDSPVDG